VLCAVFALPLRGSSGTVKLVVCMGGSRWHRIKMSVWPHTPSFTHNGVKVSGPAMAMEKTRSIIVNRPMCLYLTVHYFL
jgi:hypothetical protein